MGELQAIEFGYTLFMFSLNTLSPWVLLYSLELIGLLVLMIASVRRAIAKDWIAGVLTAYLGVLFALQLVTRAAALGWITGLSPVFITRLDQFGAFIIALLAWHTLRVFLKKPLVWGLALGLGWVTLSLFLQNILLVFIGWLAVTLLTIVFLISQLQMRKLELQQNRLHYWIPIVALSVLNDSLIFYAQAGQTVFLRLAIAALLSYCLLSQRVANTRDLTRQLLTYLTVSLSMMAVYMGAYLGSQAVLQNTPSFNPLFLGAGIAVVLSFVFAPFLSFVRDFYNRIFIVQAYDASRILREYAISVSNILDLDRLATVSAGLIMEALEIRKAALFLIEMEISEGHNKIYRLSGISGAGNTLTLQGTLAEDSPIAQHLAGAREPLLQADIDFDPRFLNAAVEERKWLSELEMEAYIPISAKGEWIGLLVLGQKPNQQRYSEEDLSLLKTIAGQTAVALENARLVENLKKLNTQVRDAYSYLDKANNHLEQLESTKSNFISIASHELRTPLTVAKGYAEMLLENPELPETVRPIVAGIQKSTLRLYEIMESMFEIAQLDARTLELHRQDMFINETLRFVFDEVSKYSAEREQDLSMDLPQLPSIKADPNTLHKLFYHLLMNAIKFTPNAGKIVVTGRYVPANNRDLPEGGVEIVVADSGVGIHKDSQEVIFTKFYQPGEKLNKHSTGKTKFQGSGVGLGLALAKGIVEAHGGRIWVESDGFDEEKYPGSQFHVILPLRSQDESKTVRMGSAVKLKI